MGGSTVVITSSSFTDLILHYGDSTSRPTYSGSGTPWTVNTTSPYRIGNNDVTGERFVLTAAIPEPVTNGAPPFALWGRTLGLQYTNRTITIPVQGYATDQQYLSRLLVEIRRRVNAAMTLGRVSLNVTYDGKAIYIPIERGVVQETDRFWNDEEGRGEIRMLLTLECPPGTPFSMTTLQNGTGYTNAVAGSSAAFSSLSGDWTRSVGQGMRIVLTGGDLALATAKTMYVASITNSGDSGALSSAISTTSTSGVAVTGSVTYGTSGSRAPRIRVLAQVTTPNAALQLRAIVQLGSSAGATIYTGPWVAAGTTTTIMDLGYLALSQTLRVDASTLLVTVQARSSTGGSATGTLARIRVLEYYSFARITIATTGTSEALHIRSPQPDAVDEPLVFMRAGGTTRQLCAVAGSLPRAIEGMSLWFAWLSGGTFTASDAVSAVVEHMPTYETLAE